MKSRTLVLVSSTIGIVLAAGLVVLGLVMANDATFATTYVKDQLGQQRITFKSLDTLTPEEKASACLRQYAGQALTTGKQAECYANEFIGLHVKEVAGGKTYAETGIPERALTAEVEKLQKANPNDPALVDMQKRLAGMRGVRGTLFQGETSRGLLLTSFGFSELGRKAGQASTASFAIAGLLALLSVTGFASRARAPKAAAVTAPGQLNGTADDKQLVTV